MVRDGVAVASESESAIVRRSSHPSQFVPQDAADAPSRRQVTGGIQRRCACRQQPDTEQRTVFAPSPKKSTPSGAEAYPISNDDPRIRSVARRRRSRNGPKPHWATIQSAVNSIFSVPNRKKAIPSRNKAWKAGSTVAKRIPCHPPPPALAWWRVISTKVNTSNSMARNAYTPNRRRKFSAGNTSGRLTPPQRRSAVRVAARSIPAEAAPLRACRSAGGRLERERPPRRSAD